MIVMPGEQPSAPTVTQEGIQPQEFGTENVKPYSSRFYLYVDIGKKSLLNMNFLHEI